MDSQQRPPPPELVSFIEGLELPHILIDRNYRILVANRAYRERYAPDVAVEGRHCYEVSHRYLAPCDEAGASCHCPRRAALSSHRAERVLHVHHTPRGEEHVQVNLSPIKDASGEIAFFIERIHAIPMARSTVAAQGLVGRSPSYLAMLDLVARVAPTDTSALLLGETGTGKELVALAIHEASRRASGPFVAVDCSGLTETLFENELFGHEKGAYTGAAARKVGLVEAASGGTLFLDEIGDIPLLEQVKLLRLIETGTYRRVGGVQPQRSEVRLVAATHRDLKAMVKEGSFRRDLYYRISAFPIYLPALRERREDIALLADTLLGRLQRDRKVTLSREARELLMAYDFPGNIRELRNVLERACLLSDGDCLHAEDLPPEVQLVRRAGAAAGSAASPPSESTLLAAERQALEQALVRHGGNRRALAESLGISERTLYRKLATFSRGASARRR